VISQHTFKKWKPGVWQALNTGLYTLDEGEEDEARQGTVPEEQHHFFSQNSVNILQGIIHVGVSL